LPQGPAQVTAQQKSSPPEQKPLRHCVPLVHDWPLTSTQLPAALHAWLAAQPPCTPAATRPQVVPPAHFPQGLAQVTAQQMSSPPEQKPLSQSLPLFAGLHVWPLTVSQTPAALHAWFAGQPP
jgi:hypothetical protein